MLVTAHLNRANQGRNRTAPALVDVVRALAASSTADAAVTAADAAIVLHRPDVHGTVPRPALLRRPGMLSALCPPGDPGVGDEAQGRRPVTVAG